MNSKEEKIMLCEIHSNFEKRRLLTIVPQMQKFIQVLTQEDNALFSNDKMNSNYIQLDLSYFNNEARLLSL